MEGDCPKCLEQLATKSYRVRPVTYCLYCEGLWLSGESIREHGIGPPSFEGQVATQHRCPDCADAELLSRIDIDGVRLEACEACKGVFFDRGELDHLYANFDEFAGELFRDDAARTARDVSRILALIYTVVSCLKGRD